jgi:hypothetical protein
MEFYKVMTDSKRPYGVGFRRIKCDVNEIRGEKIILEINLHDSPSLIELKARVEE